MRVPILAYILHINMQLTVRCTGKSFVRFPVTAHALYDEYECEYIYSRVRIPPLSLVIYMGQDTELWLSFYLVLLSIESKTK